jgi:formylglycine-generating enzyme required for sulfatase activity
VDRKEFATLRTDSEKSSGRKLLLEWYSDDTDSGIHSACEWCLRQLAAESELGKVVAAYATGEVIGDRQWYVTKQGHQTLLLVDGGKEFLMGSPVTEAERTGGPTGKNAIRHRRLIGRKFAIGAHEVTVSQFSAFREDHEFERTYARESNAPANLISWYDAAAYCNWLSKP